jgi:nuclear transport factor 2 (NTF2) superfamily protein
MWCIPELNDAYKERMEDVLNLYNRKYNEKEPVLCLDEKPIQLLEDMLPVQPAVPGRLKRRDSKYIRKGTANTYCVVEPKAGKHLTYVTKKKGGTDIAKVMNRISRVYRRARRIHLVMDNFCTHGLNSLIKQYGQTQGKKIWGRFRIHYTPINASWLNQAEIEIGIYSKQCLGKDRIASIADLRQRTNFWNKEVNKKKLKIMWRFTTKEARIKFNYGK